MSIYSEEGMNGSATPGCVIVVVDQSNSMVITPKGASKSKAQFAAEAVSELFKELAGHCVKNNRAIDRIWLGAIGYSTGVRSLWNDSPTRSLRPMTEVYQFIEECEDNNRDLFQVVSDGVTRMDLAFDAVNEMLDEHAQRIKQSAYYGNFPFPSPVVLHITDGNPTDSDGVVCVKKGDGGSAQINLPGSLFRIQKRAIETDEGSITVINIYLGDDWSLTPVIFPEAGHANFDPLSSALFEASSIMTAKQVGTAKAFFPEIASNISTRSRCLGIQVDAKTLSKIMSWGSITPSDMKLIE